MLGALTGFVGELRAAGLPVSLTETLDALNALQHVSLADRPAVRAALASTLVKRAEHEAAFDAVFDVWFSLRPASEVLAGEGLGPVSDEELAEMVVRALRDGDPSLLATLARLAVARQGGIDPARPVGGAYYVHRALRRLDPEGALERLLAGTGNPPDPSDDPLAARLRADDQRARVEALRAEVEAEVRRHLVAHSGPEAVARSVRRPLPEDVDLMHASPEQAAALRRALRPLARKLAARVAHRRRHRRQGALDFRATMRHSLSYGGAPAEPRFRHPRPAKPEIVVIADISGSVAAFARFTLQFVHALAGEFARVRSFVFIDGIDEVTRLFEGAPDLDEAVQRVNAEADVVWAEGHSDYGHALRVFWERWGTEVTRRTSVVVLGDARNNYHPAEAWVLGELRRRARRVYWLNPEPRSYWDTGDSIVAEYARHCDGVFECRSLRQLERFVEHVA